MKRASFFETWLGLVTDPAIGTEQPVVLPARILAYQNNRNLAVSATNTVIGDAGDNVLEGTSDADSFDGRDGSDSYLVRADSNVNAYFDTGVSGIDTILAVENRIGIELGNTFGPENGIEVISAGGNNRVGIAGSAASDRYDFSQVALDGIWKIELYTGDDSVIGSDGADDIRGDSGSDHIRGGAGDDVLQGGGRNDWNPEENAKHKADGDDRLYGNAGNDSIAGGAGNDTISGGRGADLLYGSIGEDVLKGGGEADTFLFLRDDEGGDTIVDFQQGSDLIDMSRIDADTDLPGHQALGFAGEAAEAVANMISYEIVGGQTFVRADTGGDLVAEFEIVLNGTIALTGDDFI